MRATPMLLQGLILGLVFAPLACTEKKSFKGGTQQGSAQKAPPEPKTAPAIPEAPAPQPIPAPEPAPIAAVPAPEPQPIPPPAPVPEPVPEPMKVIEFGADKVFRIGDGSAGKESACVNELMGYDLKGSVYNFQFEVLEDNTKVDLSIGKICGIDSASLTVISLVNKDSGKVEVAEQAMATDSKSDRSQPLVPFSIPVLAKGNYSLVIKSKSTLGITDEVAAKNYPGLDHHDDFIVGKITLNGDKLLRGLKVTTE